MGNGALPNGLSYRAHPRLYRNGPPPCGLSKRRARPRVNCVAAAEGTDTRVCGDVVTAPHSILDADNLYVCQGCKPQFDRIALAGRSTSEYVLCNLQTVKGREHHR